MPASRVSNKRKKDTGLGLQENKLIAIKALSSPTKRTPHALKSKVKHNKRQGMRPTKGETPKRSREEVEEDKCRSQLLNDVASVIQDRIYKEKKKAAAWAKIEVIEETSNLFTINLQ